MGTKEINITYEVLQERASLDQKDKILVEAAEQAASSAYAPYSGFPVGAALAYEDGRIVTGNNQENASFPAGICAERVAIFSAVSQDPGKAIRALAIIASSQEVEWDKPVPPCGICRQVVAEYEAEQGSPIRILLCTLKGPIHIFGSMKDLLPFHFHEKVLKRY